MIRVLKAKAYHVNKRDRIGKLHFWFKGETVIDHLTNRFKEPHREVKMMLPAILAQAGVAGLEKASWSQKCGCLCGCSPGFKLYGATFEGSTQFSVYVDLEYVTDNATETAVSVTQ
jgi:hypothetical protein